MGRGADKGIILFDGVCNFCNGAVNFIIDRDPDDHFRFASLQSETAKKLLEEYHKHSDNLDTLVLIEDGKYYIRSTAALRIARKLSGIYRLAYGLILIPAPIRDIFYWVFAKSRYRLFGKREVCRIPTQEEKSRFIE